MYAYGDHHLVHTISEEYLLPAIRKTEHIFVSSRCRTCYRGTSYDTTPRHQRDVFMDRLLSMTTIHRFHADVAALLAVNQLPILKNRKGVDLNYAPIWPAHLDEQRRNFLLHQRRQFGLAAAKHILSRYET